MNKIIKIIMGTVVIQFVLLFVYLAGSHMMQLALPRAYRYTYNSVVPAQVNYEVGDDIYLLSNVTRRRSIQTQRQDTMFCDNGKRTKKYPTQYRPPVGKEVPKIGSNVSEWLYDINPLPSEEQCQVCGVVVSETEYGYNKNYEYCTKRFGVNGKRPELNNTVAINIY